jgi:hypothetical protein
MTTRALSADTARKTQLEDCEIKIRTAFRRGLEATCLIAKELHKIYRDELYTEKTADFSEYITEFLQIDLRTYRRIIAVSQTVQQLQDAGLALPANESQAAELSRLEPELRATVWNNLVIRAEGQDKILTTEDVKHAVEQAEAAQPVAAQAQAQEGGQVEIEMGDQENGQGPPARKKSPAQEGVLVLTEKGEAALNRIRKICGAQIAQAIEEGTRAMTEREIRNWAEYDDQMMRNLTYYVIDKNWPLNKAVAFENKAIEDSTDVHELILIASARGGSAAINYENRARIVIELTPK